MKRPTFPVSDLTKMTILEFTRAFTYSHFEIPVQYIMDAIQTRLTTQKVGKVRNELAILPGGMLVDFEYAGIHLVICLRPYQSPDCH